MPAETLLRLTAGFLFVAMLGLWTRNLLRVGITRDVFYSPSEGWRLAAPIRLLAGLSLVGMALYLLTPSSMTWSQLRVPSYVRWLGAPLGLAGVALFGWVLQTLGRGFSMSITIRSQQSLIREGPYRRIRHPMYDAFLLLWLSFSLLSANWFVAASGLGAYAIAIVLRTPREEALLVEAFGEEYREYCRDTGRYLPRVCRRHGRPIVQR